MMNDNDDENNENIINTQTRQVDIGVEEEEETPLESEPPIHLVTPSVFLHTNPELNTIYWDVEEENITIDEELKQRKKASLVMPPMYDDIVADELEEEYGTRYKDFYEYDSVLAPQVEDSFLQSAASVNSLLSMIVSESSYNYASESSSTYPSCPSTPPERAKPKLTISATSKRKRQDTGGCTVISPPPFEDPCSNIDKYGQRVDDGDIYGKEYITGSDGVTKEFQTLRAAFRSRKKVIPKKTTFLTLKQLKKKYKQSPEVKLKNVVSMLKQVQYVIEAASPEDPTLGKAEKASFSPRPNMPNLLITEKDLFDRAETFLAHTLGAAVISLSDLLKVATGSIILKNKPLASFNSQLKYFLMASRKNKDLSDAAADILSSFPIASNLEFPDVHRGIGQVNAASRSFVNLMSDLLSPQLLKKVNFETQILHENAVVNARKDQLLSQFSWQTFGMKDMGYAEELSFNGLIRCAFNTTGMISGCTISYDCYTIVRSFSQMSTPKGLASTE